MDQSSKRKMLASVLVVAVAVSALLVMRQESRIPGAEAMNRKSVEYLENWTAKSIATFGVAKGINATLSVVEDSEFQVSLFDVAGANLAAGEVVRPLNDMVDKVASVALASAISLGIQRILLEIGSWVGLRLLLVSMVCLFAGIWAKSLISEHLVRLAFRILAIAVVATLLVPAAVLATGYAGERFMEGTYADAQQKLEELDAEAREANSLDITGDDSSSRGLFGTIGDAVDGVQKKVSGLGDRWATKASVYSGVAIDYMVVFILQTMILPVLILWGLIRLLGYLVGLVPKPAAIARQTQPA